MLGARDGISQRAVCVIEIRGPFEAGKPLGRRCVVVVVRMKFAAESAELALELARVDDQPARQPKKREVIAVAAECQDAAALRTEMLVHRSARAAIAALER